MTDEELAMILLGRLTFRCEKLAQDNKALREAQVALAKQYDDAMRREA